MSCKFLWFQKIYNENGNNGNNVASGDRSARRSNGQNRNSSRLTMRKSHSQCGHTVVFWTWKKKSHTDQHGITAKKHTNQLENGEFVIGRLFEYAIHAMREIQICSMYAYDIENGKKIYTHEQVLGNAYCVNSFFNEVKCASLYARSKIHLNMRAYSISSKGFFYYYYYYCSLLNLSKLMKWKMRFVYNLKCQVQRLHTIYLVFLWDIVYILLCEQSFLTVCSHHHRRSVVQLSPCFMYAPYITIQRADFWANEEPTNTTYNEKKDDEMKKKTHTHILWQ